MTRQTLFNTVVFKPYTGRFKNRHRHLSLINGTNDCTSFNGTCMSSNCPPISVKAGKCDQAGEACCLDKHSVSNIFINIMRHITMHIIFKFKLHLNLYYIIKSDPYYLEV